MEAEHQAEEKPVSQYCHMGYISSPPARKERETTPCPFCGRETWVKELGRTGKRDNLAAYRRVVVLRWYRGAFWARAYYSSKKYEFENNLTGKPSWTLFKVYRFKPGEAVYAYKYWSGADQWDYINSITERPKKLPLPIHEPFTHNSDEGMGYSIIGADEINKSPFRYCRFDLFIRKSFSAIKFLSVCCMYPRQIEMLMKAGMIEAVVDLVDGRKWNAAAFKWNEKNPLISFGLCRDEMKEFLAGSKNLELLGHYKRFRKLGLRCSFEEMDKLERFAPQGKWPELLKKLKLYKINPADWNVYIDWARTEIQGKRKRGAGGKSYFSRHWREYI